MIKRPLILKIDGIPLYQPSFLKNPDNFWWASSEDSWYLVAREALDCGESETTTTLCLSTSPVYMFKNTM